MLTFQNLEFEILADFLLLAFENREFKILAFQNHEFIIKS